MSLGLVTEFVGRVEHRLRRTSHRHRYPKVGFGEKVVPSAYFPMLQRCRACVELRSAGEERRR